MLLAVFSVWLIFVSERNGEIPTIPQLNLWLLSVERMLRSVITATSIPVVKGTKQAHEISRR